MFKLIDKTIGLRVSPEEELEGLDLAEHGGNAYPDFEVSSYGGMVTGGGPGVAVPQPALATSKQSGGELVGRRRGNGYQDSVVFN